MKHIQLQLPDELHSELKLGAFKNGITLARHCIDRLAHPLVEVAGAASGVRVDFGVGSQPKTRESQNSKRQTGAAPATKEPYDICIHGNKDKCITCGFAPFDAAHRAQTS